MRSAWTSPAGVSTSGLGPHSWDRLLAPASPGTALRDRADARDSGGLGPLSLRELSPQDLSGRRAGDLVDELDLTDALVVGDPLLHESDELVRRRLRVRTKLHEGLRYLSGFLICFADDAGVGDGGVLAEHRLDLGRSDPEPLVFDELLLAIDDENVAAVVP